MPGPLQFEDDAGIQEVPLVNEADPGLGRRDRYIDHARQTSGGLPDDPADALPVTNKQPFKNLRR